MAKEELDFEENESEKDLGGRNEPTEGTYHLCVLDVDEDPADYDGFKIQLQVLAGTVENQAGRSYWQGVNAPEDTHKDGGKFAKDVRKKLALVLGLVGQGVFGKKASVDWAEARGRQMVAKLKVRKWTSSKGTTGESPEIDGLNMWRVDHPEVAAVPKDAEAMALLGISVPPAGAAGAAGAPANGNGGQSTPATDAYAEAGL
jgi:hypothetical protein